MRGLFKERIKSGRVFYYGGPVFPYLGHLVRNSITSSTEKGKGIRGNRVVSGNRKTFGFFKNFCGDSVFFVHKLLMKGPPFLEGYNYLEYPTFEG